jgi:hypothetical protein
MENENRNMRVFKDFIDAMKEFRERFGEQLRVAHMLNVHRADGAFWAWGLFFVIIFSIGAYVCANATEPTTFKAMLFFLGFMFLFLTLVLYVTSSNKRKIVSLLQVGQVSKATVTKRYEVKNSGDILPSYYYLCTFEASLNNGNVTTIEAALPYKVEDQFRVGDTLTVRYSPQDPRRCAEEPSERQRRSLLSTRTAWFNVVIGIICVGITLGGFHKIIGESLGKDGQSVLRLTDWTQVGSDFFTVLWSHPIARLRFEVLLLSASIGVVGYALYALLLSTSRREED